MGLRDASIQTRMNCDRSSEGGTTSLRGRWLVLARVTWISVVGLTLLIWVLSVPVRYAQLGTVCTSDPNMCGPQQPTLASLPGLRAAGISLGFYAAYIGTVEVAYVLVYIIVALLIFWRKSDTRIGLFSALFLVTFGVSSASATDTLALAPIWQVLGGYLQFLGLVCLGVFLSIFPDGRFVPSWTRLAIPIWIVVVLLLSKLSFLAADAFLVPLYGFLLLSLFFQVYRYRRVSSPRQRQQTKWVVFGVITAIAGFLGLSASVYLFSLEQHPGSFGFLIGDTAVYLFLALIPLSIGFAIVSSQLYDIDIIINRTLVYGTLMLILTAVYVGLIIGLSALLRSIISQDNSVAIVISTLAIYFMFQPLRRRIQRLIDRRFYRSKYDAAKTVAAFSATLRQEVDLDQLREQLLAVVQETMQPAHVSLWLRPPEPSRKRKTWLLARSDEEERVEP